MESGRTRLVKARNPRNALAFKELNLLGSTLGSTRRSRYCFSTYEILIPRPPPRLYAFDISPAIGHSVPNRWLLVQLRTFHRSRIYLPANPSRVILNSGRCIRNDCPGEQHSIQRSLAENNSRKIIIFFKIKRIYPISTALI